MCPEPLVYLIELQPAAPPKREQARLVDTGNRLPLIRRALGLREIRKLKPCISEL